jgi:hypothetical protein
MSRRSCLISETEPACGSGLSRERRARAVFAVRRRPLCDPGAEDHPNIGLLELAKQFGNVSKPRDDGLDGLHRFKERCDKGGELELTGQPAQADPYGRRPRWRSTPKAVPE